AAARLYADAFAAEPKLADDLKFPHHRYNAACYAALAAAGKGEDAATLPEKERAGLRRQALDWLQAELAAAASRVEKGQPHDLAGVQHWLSHWKNDSDLVSLHDKDALAALPEAERAAFAKLWADVDALLRETSKEK